MQDMKAQKLRKEDRMEIKRVKSKDAWNGEKKDRKDIEIFQKDTLIILKCEEGMNLFRDKEF